MTHEKTLEAVGLECLKNRTEQSNKILIMYFRHVIRNFEFQHYIRFGSHLSTRLTWIKQNIAHNCECMSAGIIIVLKNIHLKNPTDGNTCLLC